MLNILNNKKILVNFLFPLILVLIGAFLYFPRVLDEFDWYNSSEFVLAAATGDVPHAPGYPLYVGLSSLFMQCFNESGAAYAVNLLTALIGVLGGVLFYFLFIINGFSAATSMLAGVLLIGGRNYTEQSIMAEVYNLEICFIILGLMVGRFIQRGNTSNLLAFFAGIIGMLGVGHRPTFGLYTLTLAVFIFASRGSFRPRASFYFWLLGGVALGLIPTILLYFRLETMPGMLFDPLMVQGFKGFLRFISGATYGGGLFVFDFSELVARFAYFIWFLALDSTPWILIGPLVLLYYRLRENKTTFIQALGWILFLNLALILNYNAFEAHTMLLPSIMCVAAFAAMSLEVVEFPRLRGVLSLVLIGFVVFYNYSMLEAPTSETRDYVARSIGTVPSASTLILSNDVEFKPYYYLRYFQGLREDLSIVLADNLLVEEMARFGEAIQNDRLFSSLVYPKNSRENLVNNYSLECYGYFYKITDYKHSEDNTSLSDGLIASMSFELLPSESTVIEAKAGECIPYSYQLCVPREHFDQVLVLTLLVTKNNETIARDGVLVGHDIHSPEEFTCKRYDSSFVNLDFGRALVLPYDLKAGEYKLYTMACIAPKGLNSTWLSYLPKNANLLNLDGYEEVFTLKYGLTARKLVRSLGFDELFGDEGLNYFASEPLLLEEFKVIP
jgi:hypothetical protein